MRPRGVEGIMYCFLACKVKRIHTTPAPTSARAHACVVPPPPISRGGFLPQSADSAEAGESLEATSQTPPPPPRRASAAR